CFFFSSRRRHTRWPRDWSSRVLFRSSTANGDDWTRRIQGPDSGSRSGRRRELAIRRLGSGNGFCVCGFSNESGDGSFESKCESRSEERRVGKEGRSGGRKGGERKESE